MDRDCGFDGAVPVLVIVHTQVGGNAERFHILRVVREDGDADAGADADRVRSQLNGLVEQLNQRTSNILGVGLAGGLFKDHGEFVSASSRDGVGTADAAGAYLGNAFEKLVYGSDVFLGEPGEFDASQARYHSMLDACQVPPHVQAMIFSGTMWRILQQQQEEMTADAEN